MDIQWYPGHMTKAKREIRENLKLVDVVIEVIDARIPASSRNPDMTEIHHIPYLLAATKVDLADPARTKVWLDFWRTQNEEVVLLDLLSGKGVKKLQTLVKKKAPDLKRLPRVLVVGIPNVGKSSLINRLAGRRSAQVGAKPGVTRGKQWINTSGMQLLDSPGILWPKFADQEVARKLAAVAAIKEEILEWDALIQWLIEFLSKHYPEEFCQRYGLDELPGDASVLETIGRKRGCLRAGGIIDLEQAARLILKEFRLGTIAPMTLELPVSEELRNE